MGPAVGAQSGRFAQGAAAVRIKQKILTQSRRERGVREKTYNVGRRPGAAIRYSAIPIFSAFSAFSASLREISALLILILLLFPSCGYLHNPRVSNAYIDNMIPSSAAANLVLWPVHLTALLACGIVDQTMRTFESVPPSGKDGVDFFLIRGSGNNVMLERTIAVPKIIATPIVMLGSYLVRWLFPLGEDTRPFGDYVSAVVSLHAAVESGDLSAIRAALDSGAPVNQYDSRDWTALMIAAHSGKKEAVEILLAAGADASLRNKEGKRAQDLALDAGHRETAEIIRKSTAGQIEPEKR